MNRIGIVVERIAQFIGVMVEGDDKVYRGVPKGKVLKKTKIYAGDRVAGKIVGDVFSIEEVFERKNVLVRPPVANVDRTLCVVTLKKPEFDNYLLDSLLVVYEHAGTSPAVIFNKVDLLEGEELQELQAWVKTYEEAGYPVIKVSTVTGEGIEDIKDLVEGEICILAGPSGVGKSSILKALTGAELRTSEVSEKTERGRHTTTGVKLIPFGKGSFLGDTPGFSKVEVLNFVRKKDVKNYFAEFSQFTCRYPDCTHTKEPDCGVKEALKEGKLSCDRFKSYLKMIKEYIELECPQ